MSINNELAPIVLFVYNRPEHTRSTIEALQKNPEARDSTLYIYSDAAKNQKDDENVGEVRNYIHQVNGFGDVKVIEREQNLGLANSIIEGVTTLCEHHGRVIVLEDDLVTSPAFLAYMNRALNHYESQKDIWHISGWSYPVEQQAALGDAFFWRAMNCWGWATWRDRWDHFKKDPVRLISTWSEQDIRRFNLDGRINFWKQVVLNHKGQLNTWAIFWYASIFENQGLCLNPSRSYVVNTGHDGSGENCRKADHFSSFQELNCKRNLEFPTAIKESEIAVQHIQAFVQSSAPSHPLIKLVRGLKNYIDMNL